MHCNLGNEVCLLADLEIGGQGCHVVLAKKCDIKELSCFNKIVINN